MIKGKFGGTGVALATPFNGDDEIDVVALTHLVKRQIVNGVDYLLILGSTGEAVALSDDEKQLVVDTVVKANKGRLPLMLGLSDNNTQRLLETIEKTDLSHFDSILSVAPWYNKPTQDGLYHHFKAVAEASPVDVVIYNVPSRTGINIEPKTVLQLAQKVPNIVGIKEAAGDMIQAMELVRILPSSFQVISGDDIVAVPMMLSGSVGIISVLAQAYPAPFTKMVNAALAGKVKEAYDLHYQFVAAIQLIFEQGNPVGIKALLSLLTQGTSGAFSADVRLPLQSATATLLSKMKKYDAAKRF